MLFDEVAYRLELDEVVTRFKGNISTLRTGKASKDTFENIMVDAYGSKMPVTQVASLVFEGAISVSVKVFDKSISSSVVDSLSAALQGASVTDQGDVIRINFRPLTQEDREARVKELKKMLEDAKVSSRLVRQDYMQKVKSADGVSEDDQKLAEKDVQEVLDEYTEKLESVSKIKEDELTTV